MKTPLQQARELHSELKKDESNVEALLRLTEFMREYEGNDRIIHSSELDDKINELENEQRYYTGIKKLDLILGGLRSNQIIALSAPPKAGKTQLCVQMARYLPNPTMFLFEESPEEVLYKYKKKGVEVPSFFTVNDLVEDDVEGLYRKMIEAWAKHNSKIFFIDHLHYILKYDDHNNTGDKIRHVMTELKKFTKRHGFTIILVAHMTKGNFTEPPGIEAIRDSSFIPQFADTTILLWRETIKSGAREHSNVYQQTNNLLINVALNRKLNFDTDINTGLVDLTFNTTTWNYEPSEWYTEWISDDEHQNETKSRVIKGLRT